MRPPLLFAALSCVAFAAAAAEPLPQDAEGLTLSAAEKSAMTDWREQLEPNLKALNEACGTVAVELDWNSWIAHHREKLTGDAAPLKTYAGKCGAAIDGVAAACGRPEKAKLMARLTAIHCSYQGSPHKSGDEWVPGKGKVVHPPKEGRWEPEFTGGWLEVGYNDFSADMKGVTLRTLEREFPSEKPAHFAGETPEQKRALELAESFQQKSLEHLKDDCHWEREVKVKMDLEGFKTGEPRPNRAVAERLEDTASKYFRRCSGAIEALLNICATANRDAAAKVNTINCRFVSGDVGFGAVGKGFYTADLKIDPKSQCAVELKGDELNVSCTWYQSSDRATKPLCKQLGIPDATPYSRPGATPSGAKCKHDSDCASLACEGNESKRDHLWGHCR